MKYIIGVFLLFMSLTIYADTPPPGTVKAKTWSGDGNTSIGATGSSLNVNVTNASGLTTVNQGTPGSQAWLVDGSAHTQPVSGTFWQTTQPVSGTLTCNAGTGTLAVSGPLTDAQLRASAVPVSGTITATNSANGNTGSAVPVQATQIGGSDGTNLRAVKVSSTGVVSVDGSASTQPVSAASLPLPAGASTSALQSSTITALGSPFQAGGSIGNSSFGISGTLPAYAATPTFNLGTLNGAATAALQTTGNSTLSTINTTLGTPFQSGGSIGNTSFAATQATASSLNATVVTTGGVAVAKDSSLSTINTTLGSPFQAGGSIGNTSFASTQSGTWTVNSKPATPTAVTVKQAAVTIGTSAVRLTNDGLVPPSTRVLLVAQLLSSSTANCFFGSSSVANSGASRGIQMFAGQSFSFNNDAGDYYAICDASSQTFLITEQE